MTATTVYWPTAILADAEFEAKHPRGEHGHFGDKTDGGLPEGWQAIEPPPGMKGPPLVGFRSGTTRVWFSSALNTTHEQQMHIVQQIDALKRSDPTGHDLRIEVLPTSEMRTPEASGETFASQVGASSIQVKAAAMFDPKYRSNSLYETGDAYARGVSKGDWVLAHEYGHALKIARDYDADKAWKDGGHNPLGHDLETIDLMKTKDPPSEYGTVSLSNVHEAYAESFADWRLNPAPSDLAKALAKHEGWGPR